MATGRQKGPDGLTIKERSIAFALDDGMSDLEAFRHACPHSKATNVTARTDVQKIKNKPKVKAFLAQLAEIRKERHVRDQDRVIDELRHWLMHDPRELFTWGPDGIVVKDSKALSAADARLVSEVSVRHGKDGQKDVRIKTIDRMATVDKLIRILGMYQDSTNFDPADVVTPEAEKLDADKVKSDIEKLFAESANEPAGGDTVVH